MNAAATLKLRGLRWGHDKKPLGGPLDLELAPGRALAIVGPNGAGKSTLLRTIAGLLPQLGGAALLGGREINALSVAARARQVAMLAQDAQVDPDLCVRELVELGRTVHLGLFGRASAADRRAVDAAIEACDLAELADRPLGQISGGELQRARLALALAQQAPLLLLDEPANHLDLRRRQELFELLARLRAERSLVMVLVLHDLADAYREADRVLVLSESGEAREVSANLPERRELLADAFGVTPERIIVG